MDNTLEIRKIIDRARCLAGNAAVDPVRGYGCGGERVEVPTPVPGLNYALVPSAMVADPQYALVKNDVVAWKRLRCRHDFEYWAVECVKIKDKMSHRDIPFVLNAPQRRVLGEFEARRLAGEPIRAILLKARQWGGSTLVQMYMAWIQSCLRTNWHSVICAHVKNTSMTIRGMYTKMLEGYPAELWEGDCEPRFVPYERSSDTREITGRDCRVTIGTSEKPDSMRGGDYAMAHLSETAYWPRSTTRSARDVVQAVCGSVAMLPCSLVVIESTANGVGDFFHSEWLRAKAGLSDKSALFVPWQEIDFNTLAGDDDDAILATLTPYELALWRRGCTAAQLRWRRRKAREFDTAERFNAEFPADDGEAFASGESAVFSGAKVEALRAGCVIEPRVGAVDASGTRFHDDEKGELSMWRAPEANARYVLAVDVGGRSANADWSVIAVLRRGDCPEVVAQWRGHTDHDLLARRCVELARFYNRGLLVIESNTFETDNYGGSSDSNLFILSRLAEEYPNVYRRESFDKVTGQRSMRVGFHTNRSTKGVLIAGLIEAVREGLYIERDGEACNELLTYCRLPNGSYAAKEGCHDDIVMTRAMALHVIRSQRSAVRLPQHFTQREHW